MDTTSTMDTTSSMRTRNIAEENGCTKSGRLEEASELVLPAPVAWDYPMSQSEKTVLFFQLSQEAEDDVPAVPKTATVARPSHSRAWDCPLSRSEKVRRLSQILHGQDRN